MPRQLSLADKIRGYGAHVVEVGGWQTRGSDYFYPKGIVVHHTAAAIGRDAPSLGICTNGRSDLPGPLCQVLISRSGVVYIIASGRANHAGSGGYMGLSGNSSVFGIEAENNGVGEAWSPALMNAYYQVCAAMLDIMGRGPEWICAHRDWTTRKIDPTGINMDAFRQNVARIRGVVVQPPKQSYTNEPAKGPIGIWQHGPRCKTWQNQLITYAGQKQVTADGFFGPDTHDATINFQRFFGLGVDGIVGAKTQGAMDMIRADKNKPKHVSLRRGSTGEAVKTIQRIVGTTVDGMFGAQTELAVRVYQKNIGVPQTGVWDAVTAEMSSRINALPDYPKMPWMQQGARGEPVKILQEALNRYAGAHLAITGVFDRETYLAVFNFQKFFGMRSDGIVGPKTWAMIGYIAKLNVK